MSNTFTTSIVLLGALAGATALLATPASAAKAKEMCYGVAMAGQNDCKAAAHDCKGMSKIDFDADSWKLVPKGSCVKMQVHGHMGMLKPMGT